MKCVCFHIFCAVTISSCSDNFYTISLNDNTAIEKCEAFPSYSCSVSNAVCRASGRVYADALYGATISYGCYCDSPTFRPVIQGTIAANGLYGPGSTKCLPTAFVPRSAASCRIDADCALIPYSRCSFDWFSFANVCVCDKASGYETVLVDVSPEKSSPHVLYRCARTQCTAPQCSSSTTTTVTPMTTPQSGQCEPGYSVINGYCAGNFGARCSKPSDCLLAANLDCIANQCFCRRYHAPVRSLLLGGKIVACKAAFGQPCQYLTDCGRPYMVCHKSDQYGMGACACPEGQGWDTGGSACMS
ncbi:uncharacterized protein LOC129600378 [Paramacrobiotus metropolitanus]|uniref:uncharacterized protein LOC129600378 n=1 Tax=Paramacrobiotus metropolitanus TaxID=2943436 RepID=UPI0024457988|nr:uncharacterized protein LOC129600378 [Paramacrobiotus metropolitanus]